MTREDEKSEENTIDEVSNGISKNDPIEKTPLENKIEENKKEKRL